jgi:predicted MFS family arabinose efflux permease
VSDTTIPKEKEYQKKWVLLGLLGAVFAVNVIDVFVKLLLPEIASTFNITKGVASQLTAFSLMAGVITGLALSAFSIRIRYKIILMTGVFCVIGCVLGVYFAPNFLLAQVFYALNGVGSIMVAVMAPTIVAELYPLEKKAVRISWIVATGQLALLIGNPVTGFIANTGVVTSWRNALLWFMLPVSVVCLLFVVFLVPSKPRSAHLGVNSEPFLSGYRAVLQNRSAVACLTNTFFAGVFLGVAFYSSSFLADVFGISPFLRSIVTVVVGSIIIAAMLIGGFLVNRIGRKRLLVASAIPAVIFSIIGYPLSYFIPNIWVILSCRFVASFLGGLPLVAGPNLYLEQVPKYRGTMMSLISALNGIGLTTGVLVGGRILDYINDPLVGYPVAMVLLGMLGLIGTLTVIIYAKDPVKEHSKSVYS